jgi:hypothetical protein
VTILATTKAWRREPAKRARLTSDRLSPEESANVRRAILFLRKRHGGTAPLAVALGVGFKMLTTTCSKKGKPGAGLALRAAKLAVEPVETILTGEWPGDRCPHCGRT